MRLFILIIGTTVVIAGLLEVFYFQTSWLYPLVIGFLAAEIWNVYREK